MPIQTPGAQECHHRQYSTPEHVPNYLVIWGRPGASGETLTDDIFVAYPSHRLFLFR